MELECRMELDVEVIVLGEGVSPRRMCLVQVDLLVLRHHHSEGQGPSNIACQKIAAICALHG